MQQSLGYAFLIVVSCVLVAQDVKFQKVNILWLAAFTLACFFLRKDGATNFLPFYIFLAIQFVYFLLKKNWCFGLADYFVVFGACFILPYETWSYFLCLCGGFGILIAVIFKKRHQLTAFPFIPAIIASTAVLLFF